MSLSILNKNSQEVRRSPDLMAIYIELFKETFGYKPNCAACTFKSDFDKLKKRLRRTEHKKETMSKTFELRRKVGDILTYRKANKTYRTYDYNMTEEFAIEFLKNGSEEEIKQREKLFKKLPEKITVEEVKKNTTKKTRKTKAKDKTE